MKRRLDAAADSTGRSQSQEAEFRLERSFDRLSLLPEVLVLAYGPELAGILMMLGIAMENVALLEKRRPPSVEDPAVTELALLAAVTVLIALHPTEEATKFVSRQDRERADQSLARLARAVRHGSKVRDPAFTAPPGPPWCDANTIRTLLGPIGRRIRQIPKVTEIMRLLFPEKSATPRTNVPIHDNQAAIAAAADSIIDLINSSPRTPSRQELTKILQKAHPLKGAINEEPKS